MNSAHKSFVKDTADLFANLRAWVDPLKGMVGYLDYLYRQPEDTVGEVGDARKLQWKLARLLKVSHERTLKDVDRIANLTIDFVTAASTWRSATPSRYPASGYDRVSAAAGVAYQNVVVDGSEVVNDFVLTLRTVDAPLSAFSVEINGARISWDAAARPSIENKPPRPAAAPIPAGSTIVINMGKETITINESDAYSNFDINTVAPGWLYLSPGSNLIQINSIGVDLDYAIDWVNQWT
jgi:hypothetical protein